MRRVGASVIVGSLNVTHTDPASVQVPVGMSPPASPPELPPVPAVPPLAPVLPPDPPDPPAPPELVLESFDDAHPKTHTRNDVMTIRFIFRPSRSLHEEE